MPFVVRDLIQEHPMPVTTSPNEPMEEVLQRMIAREFSQLPVINNVEKPLGMVTFESILWAQVNFGVSIEQLLVKDAMVRAHIYRDDADLFDLLDQLRDSNAVLIVDGEDSLAGIVTTFDTTEYFRRRAEDMMLIVIRRISTSFVYYSKIWRALPASHWPSAHPTARTG